MQFLCNLRLLVKSVDIKQKKPCLLMHVGGTANAKLWDIVENKNMMTAVSSGRTAQYRARRLSGVQILVAHAVSAE
jgi:hypothetical protein